MELFTIGHSRHPIERFIALLQQHGIDVVADVRSTPYSRFNPQFNRTRLEQELSANRIQYEFLGEELGARSKDPACYEGRRVSYAKLAASPKFKSGLERLRTLMAARRVAMMCAEREPLDCHRTILVAREMERAGVSVVHILANGELESNELALQRLIALLKLPQDDLFRDSRELIDAAYDAQAARLAYSLV